MDDEVTMNASIVHASYSKPGEECTFHSLAELMAFIKEAGHDVVIGQTDDRWFITIYDDYLE